MKFENAALFICYENGSFWKTLFKPEEFKLKRRLRVWKRVDGEVFENGLVENGDVTKIT